MSSEEDIDQRLADLEAKVTECTTNCSFRSAHHIAKELRRLAKSEQRVIPYLYAGFHLMTQSSDLLEPEQGRDVAIELIGLLESEDRARAIEPDLPEEEYSHTVHWMTACAYDNLAKATAVLQGFNSEGMHQCITDGIQVCRRTGKLECVRCFREYATDVYLASDDLDLAIQFARMGIAHANASSHDRRWVGAKDLANLLLLKGDLDGAAEAAEQAWNFGNVFHNPRSAMLQTHLVMRSIFSLLGDAERIRAFDVTPDGQPFTPAISKGEYPYYEMKRDQVEAVEASCNGRMDDAIELVTRWDRILRDKRCLHYWLQNRLQLAALHRLAGNDQQVQAIIADLKKKANDARDWLALRCMAWMENAAARPLPLPLVANVAVGPFAVTASVSHNTSSPQFSDDTALGVSPESKADEGAADDQSQVASKRPELTERANQLHVRLGEAHVAYHESQDEAAFEAAQNAILRDILAIEPSSVTDPFEARALLHMARFVLGESFPGASLWRWAEAVAALHLRDAPVLGVLATLGAALRFRENSDCTEMIDERHLESLFRQAMDLDPRYARNFRLAGDFFLFLENHGEAERCFARGFRLDRTDSQLALPLASIYQRTDRQREALFVLDLALREGCDDPEVSWRAALAAFQLQQYEATISYLDRYESQLPGQPWVNYYRAAALIELNRAAESLAANDEERERNPECLYHFYAYRACALAMLGQSDEFRETLAKVIDMRLAEVDYLSPTAVRFLLERLWNRVIDLPDADPLRERFETLVLCAGFAPDDLFHRLRKTSQAEAQDVNYYECNVVQPLDDRWPTWLGCRHGEESWLQYEMQWGVLARSPDEAQSTVLQWQSKCFPLPADQIEVELREEHYRDCPGIVWQGERVGSSEN
jgi:tetratricopeptide (TPR) repeat protein